MTIFLKIKQEYYEPIIDGRKPFEIRETTDRKFSRGDTVILNEYRGKKYVPACECNRDCEGWDAIANIPEYSEDEAIDACGVNRKFCSAYYDHYYTGRRCKIHIKEVFNLSDAGLKNYVAFTFDILKTDEEKPYSLAEKIEE